MAEIALPMMVVNSLISAGSSVMGGLQANAAGKAQQKQHQAQANTARALAQRKAIEERRQAAYGLSRALAVGAASGAGGVETEGFANIVGGIEEEGHRRAMMALWQGDDQAAGQEHAGRMARWQGKRQKKAGFLNAATTLLNTGASIAGNGGYASFAGASAGAEGRLR